MKSIRWACTGWILLLLVIGVGAAGAQGITPPSGEIAFTSDRSGTYQIYLMNADGSNVRQLTHDKVSAYAPIWSPDGQKLLYASGTDVRQSNLMMIDADGSHPRLIASNIASIYECIWSPDSQWLIYTVTLVKGEAHLPRFYRINADGTDNQLLGLPYDSKQMVFGGVSFFPDGNHLLIDDIDKLYIADPDGSYLQTLTTKMGLPAKISPDGKSIVSVEPDVFGSDIGKTNIQGNNFQSLFSELTSTNRKDLHVLMINSLDWSPDSYYISGVVLLDLYSDGTATPDLRTTSPFRIFIGTANGDDYWLYPPEDSSLSWSPDSQWVAFEVQTDAEHVQIAISEPIGTNRTILTSGSNNSEPGWRPSS